MPTVSLDDIQAAHQRIRDKIMHSPCTYSLALSRLCGCEIWCKHDNVQVTGSFKERGARNRLLQLNDEQKKAGVIAASAGNHALGLVYHGQLLGIPVTVVMPRFAPLTKVTNCQRMGAHVVLHGQDISEARSRADEIAEEKKLTYINGYDDPE